MKTPAIHPGVAYRADVDGLRAIAVIPVLLFHAGVRGFGGGYVGVDVFFVISGYLISQVLVRDWRSDEFSVVNFYERRARRILPALFAVMAFSAVLAMLVMVPPDLKAFTGSVLAAATFWSNNLFWSQDGYFTAASHYKPLLHTWSLAVEEQFYILYPLALWLILKTNRTQTFFAILLGLSFVLSAWAVTIHQSAAFYLAPFRAWELLLGGSLAIVRCPPIKSQPIAESLAVAGLSAILIAIFAFDTSTQVPGIPAIVPCLGTVVLLHVGGSMPTFTNKALQFPPLVNTGLISYSLYLWHWPLLAFARLYLLRPLTTVEVVVVLIGSAILATLSWRFIEMPFRRRIMSKHLRRYFALMAAFIFIAVIATTYATDGLPERFSPSVNYLASFENRPDIRNKFATLGLSSCFDFRDDDTLTAQVNECAKSKGHHPSILVWGDSHAAMYFAGLNDAAPFWPAHVSVAAMASCAPIVQTSNSAFCSRFNAAVMRDLATEKFDVVLIAGFWSSLDRQQLLQRIRETAEQTSRLAARVVVLGPSIEFDESLPVILARDASRGRPSLNHTRQGLVAFDEQMEIALRGVPHTTFISILRIACPAGNCPTVVGGVPITSDESHLTSPGGDWVAFHALMPSLQQIVQQE